MIRVVMPASCDTVWLFDWWLDMRTKLQAQSNKQALHWPFWSIHIAYSHEIAKRMQWPAHCCPSTAQRPKICNYCYSFIVALFDCFTTIDMPTVLRVSPSIVHTPTCWSVAAIFQSVRLLGLTDNAATTVSVVLLRTYLYMHIQKLYISKRCRQEIEIGSK